MTDEEIDQWVADIREKDIGWTSKRVHVDDIFLVCAQLALPPWQIGIIPGGAVMTGIRMEPDREREKRKGEA